MPKFSKPDHTTRWIPVKQISVVWANAQRNLNEREVQRIIDDFDADAFGTVQVTLPNGKDMHHCIDGQTRVEAVRRMYGDDEKVPCNVLDAKEPARAADLFSKMNTGRTKPQLIERFQVAVTAQYEVEVAINKLLTGMGYKVGADGRDGTLSAVGVCTTVYKRYGADALRDALLVIQGTWGKERESVDGAIIMGYAMFLNKHGKQIDRHRLVNRMSKQYTPARLIGAAKSAREVWRGSVASNVVRVLLSSYNHGLKSKRLEDQEPIS